MPLLLATDNLAILDYIGEDKIVCSFVQYPCSFLLFMGFLFVLVYVHFLIGVLVYIHIYVLILFLLSTSNM